MTKQVCKWCGMTSECKELNGNFVYFDNPSAKQCKTCRNGRARYGLDRLQQLALLDKQGGVCYMCEQKITLFSGQYSAKKNPNAAIVEHCHTTKKVRGIACHPCNNVLGKIDNLEIDPIKYLNKLISLYEK